MTDDNFDKDQSMPEVIVEYEPLRSDESVSRMAGDSWKYSADSDMVGVMTEADTVVWVPMHRVGRITEDADRVKGGDF